MKWAELIMVRSGGNGSEGFETTLEELMNEVKIETGQNNIQVFRREKIDSDICLFLFHHGKKKCAGGSTLALHLVAALKDVGLVNHTIWIAINK